MGNVEYCKVYVVANEYGGEKVIWLAGIYWYGRINKRQWCQSAGGSSVIARVDQQCMQT